MPFWDIGGNDPDYINGAGLARILFEQETLPESDRLFPGETYQRAFDKPGTYPYRCGPHPEMLGVIEVAE